MKKKWIVVFALAVMIVLDGILLGSALAASQMQEIAEGEVRSVALRGELVSEQRRDELIGLINNGHKRRFPMGTDDPGDLSVFVRIDCADGGFYYLHYQYYSGYSFHPSHPGEDDYRSILSRYDSSGRGIGAWKLDYGFDEKFVQWVRKN
jgi:hypothetical protein